MHGHNQPPQKAPAAPHLPEDQHEEPREVDIRLPGKGNSNFHGARPVHQIILIITWIRTRRLSIKKSLSLRATSWEESSGVTEYSSVNMVGSRCESVIFEAEREPDRPKWLVSGGHVFRQLMATTPLLATAPRAPTRLGLPAVWTLNSARVPRS